MPVICCKPGGKETDPPALAIIYPWETGILFFPLHCGLKYIKQNEACIFKAI